jgi:hypothetical protein
MINYFWSFVEFNCYEFLCANFRLCFVKKKVESESKSLSFLLLLLLPMPFFCSSKILPKYLILRVFELSGNLIQIYKIFSGRFRISDFKNG